MRSPSPTQASSSATSAVMVGLPVSGQPQGQAALSKALRCSSRRLSCRHHPDLAPHHRQLAPLQPGDVAAEQMDQPARRSQRQVDQPQQRGLARPGGAGQEMERAGRQFERQVAEHLVGAAVAQADAVEADHGSIIGRGVGHGHRGRLGRCRGLADVGGSGHAGRNRRPRIRGRSCIRFAGHDTDLSRLRQPLCCGRRPHRPARPCGALRCVWRALDGHGRRAAGPGAHRRTGPLLEGPL